MLLIIEGADLTGKSTLAGALQRRLEDHGYHVDVRHCGPPRTHPLNEYELALDEYHPGGTRAVIYDRHAHGELVYGPLLRGAARLDHAQLLHVELYLRSRGAVLVVLTGSLHVLRRRLSERGDDLIQAAQLPRILAGFGWLTGHSVLEPVVLQDPDETAHAALVHLGADRARQVRDLAPFPQYIGARRPAALLLGDAPGRRSTRAEADFAACFVPFREGSGHFLMRALRETELPPHVGVANTDTTNVRGLWEVLGRPPVITLGTLASHRLRALGLRHARADHPQWVRRFKHAEVEEYGKLLARAAEVGRGDFTMSREW